MAIRWPSWSTIGPRSPPGFVSFRNRGPGCCGRPAPKPRHEPVSSAGADVANRAIPRLGRVASWEPNVVCISQGTTFEMLSHWTITRFVNEYGGPYIVICQHNSEDSCLAGEDPRRTAINYFARAQRVAFVAERNLRVAEPQLAAGPLNACVVRNPVNLADSHAVPYPCSDVVKMASVARLEAQSEGQESSFRP